MLSLLEFNLEDQKQATYKMFGPDTDYSLIDEGKQCGICLFVCLSICLLPLLAVAFELPVRTIVLAFCVGLQGKISYWS